MSVLAIACGAGCFHEALGGDDEQSSRPDTGLETDGASQGSQGDAGDGGAGTGLLSGADDGGSGGASSSGEAGSTGSPPEAEQVVFLNFDGATIVAGTVDDATQDETGKNDTEGVYAPFGDDAMAEAIVAAVASQWLEFDVAFTRNRPASGDYTMVVISPSDPHMLGALANADVDCGNANPNSVGFVYQGPGGHGVEVKANVISWTLARGFGLEPVTDPSDLAYTGVSQTLRQAVDLCVDIVATPALCKGSHEVHCGMGTDQQNSHRELMLTLGPA